MMLFKTLYEHLFIWQFWSICAAIYAVVWLANKRNWRMASSLKSLVFPNYVIYFFVLLIGVVITIPFWYDGGNSSVGTGTDCWFFLLTRMAARMQGESSLWNRMLVSGGDFILLNLRPFSIIRIYSQLLSIWQELTFIILMNMMLMFVFSRLILIKILKCDRWFAFLGALLCSLTQGYWGGGGISGDAYGIYSHGITALPLMVYILIRYFNSRYIYLYAIALGILYSCFISFPLHNIPMAMITVGIWLYVFYGSQHYYKCFLILLLLTSPIFLVHLDYFITIIYLLPETARGALFMRAVGFFPYPFPIRIIAVFLVLMLLLSVKLLKLNKDEMLVRMLFLLGAFLSVPLVSYIIQETKIVPSYRWHLLFRGNQFPFIIAFVFIAGKVWRAIYERHRITGIWVFTCSSFLLVTLNLFWLLNNVGHAVYTHYKNGGWEYFTNNEALNSLNGKKNEPARILNFGTDVHSTDLGYYQGLELANGMRHFLSKDIAKFWFYLIKNSPSNSTLYEGLLIFEKNPADLSSIRLELLNLMNVKYILSNIPLSNKKINLIHYTQGIGDINKQECPEMIKGKRMVLLGGVMWTNLFDGLSFYWPNLKCAWKNRDSRPPLYVYAIKDFYPRIYLARQVRLRTAGNEFMDPDYVEFVGQKKGILTMPLKTGTYKDSDTFSAKGTIQIMNYKQDRIDFNINTDSKQFVILSDPNNRFWKLFINGKKVDHYRTNIVQTGFFVDNGLSQATYVYCPPLRAKADICRL